MTELRAAIIGYGLAGATFHAPLIAATEGMTVAAVVSGDPQRQQQVGRDHPGARVLSRAEEVFERRRDFDLVVIAAPNETHVALARRAVDAGLAVVVDKPLAPTAEDGRALVSHAAGHGVPLTVFHNRRWDADQRTLRRLISEGELGTVLRYESRFERWRPHGTPGAWREATPPSEGGGLLLDLGSHLVDQALALFGAVTHVYGEVDRRRGGVADDDVFVALRHATGVHSHLWASSVSAAPGPRLRVLGSGGAYLVEALDGQEDALRAGRRPDAHWGEEPPARWGRLVRDPQSDPVRSEPGAWPEYYSSLAAALNGAGALPVDPWDAVVTLDVLEAARESAATGTLVALDQPASRSA